MRTNHTDEIGPLCEHVTVNGHLPYNGLGDCCACGAAVYLHRPKRGPEGPGLPVPDYIGAALSGS